MTKTLAAIGAMAIGWPAAAYLLMVTVGVIRAHWIPWLPTVGYAPAVLVTVLLGARNLLALVVGSALKAAIEDKP